MAEWLRVRSARNPNNILINLPLAVLYFFKLATKTVIRINKEIKPNNQELSLLQDVNPLMSNGFFFWFIPKKNERPNRNSAY